MSGFFSKADRLQRSRQFKIGATIAVLLGGAALAGWSLLYAEDVVAKAGGADAPEIFAEILGDTGAGVLGSVGALTGVVLGLVVIWLGLGLTYLLLAGPAAGLCWLLLRWDATEGFGRIGLGVVALACSFTALLSGLRILYSGPGPVFAVARNVLAEAVRLRLSVVLIVLLVLGMATLPTTLDVDQPLRYRVQSFLQYATGGSFWIIAVLTLLFSVGTVTFEQRDKVIWQTMTKPVAAWQYLLGKWIGVSGLIAVLLGVCSTGVFLFTEHLRDSPAIGERSAYQAVGGGISEDRLILETQVLAARDSIQVSLPPYITEAVLEEAVEARLQAQSELQELGLTPDEEDRLEFDRVVLRMDIFEEMMQQYRSIETGEREFFLFESLAEARSSDKPVTLRYRVDAVGNRPDIFYNISFLLPDGQVLNREVGLGISHTITIDRNYIDENGRFVLGVVNGRLFPSQTGSVGIDVSSSAGEVQRTISFPPDGLEINYAAGSYRMNFMRVIAILWIKLAFLAMLGVSAGTFLSFPVASLVAIGVFLVAEGAGFLTTAIETYSLQDYDGSVIWYRVPIVYVSKTIVTVFAVYAELRPTARLVDGRLLGWGQFSGGLTVLGIATSLLYALGVLIFRRRELATYSGS